jgi:hypothetical protein
MRFAPLVVSLLSLAVAACSGGGSSSSEAVASQQIGAVGGVLEMTTGELAGLRVEVPPGATAAPVQISIAQEFGFIQPGFSNLSRGIVIGPQSLEFSRPVTVTLPFDFNRQSRPVVVLAREASGRVLEVAGVTEPDTGRATFQTLNFPARYMVAERLLGWVNTNPTGLFGSTPGMMPLHHGNRWNFNNGLVATMDRTTTEPNLQGAEVFKFTVSSPNENLGFYLRRIDAPPFAYGPTEVVGEFSTNGGTDYQQLHDLSLFLPAEVTLGQPMIAVLPALVYEPYGSTGASSAGTEALQILPSGSDRVQTSVGRFQDVVRIRWEMESLSTNGSARSGAVEMTFARGVGPVAITAFGVSGVLSSGTVNNAPIVGQ